MTAGQASFRDMYKNNSVHNKLSVVIDDDSQHSGLTVEMTAGRSSIKHKSRRVNKHTKMVQGDRAAPDNELCRAITKNIMPLSKNTGKVMDTRKAKHVACPIGYVLKIILA